MRRELSKGKTAQTIFAAMFVLAVFSFVQPASAAGVETPIVLNPSTQRYPAIDGNRVVWSDNRNGNWDIYMRDLATSVETQITNDTVDQTHPDISGNRIVWLNWYSWGSVDVHIYDLQTGTQSRIPFNGISTVIPLDSAGSVFFPKISGNTVVWENPTNTYGVGIYAYDINLGTITKISHNAGWFRQVNPSISGDKVVWEDWGGGDADVYMYNLTTGIETRVTNNNANQRYPEIDGNKIVWMGNGIPNRAYDIYVYDLVTQTENRISISGPGNTNYPKISGDKVIWWDLRSSELRPGLSSIYMYDLTTQTEAYVTPNNANIQSPGSSAISGDKIVWTDYRNGNADIYMYDLHSNVAPVAQIGQVATTFFGQATSFDGSSSNDSDGAIANYHWDFGDGSNGDGITTSHAYASAGTYQVTLTVTDNDGATATATTTVKVDALPVAHIAPVATRILGETSTFDGSASSDSDGSITEYSWNFGDGSTATGSNVTHAYAAAGTYQTVLAVTDNDGATGTTTATVIIQTSSQAINSLITTVQNMNLARGITNSLDSKLQNADDALNAANADNRGDAINKLQAFISATQAQSGNQLTVDQANQLIEMANRLIAVLQ